MWRVECWPAISHHNSYPLKSPSNSPMQVMYSMMTVASIWQKSSTCQVSFIAFSWKDKFKQNICTGSCDYQFIITWPGAEDFPGSIAFHNRECPGLIAVVHLPKFVSHKTIWVGLKSKTPMHSWEVQTSTQVKVIKRGPVCEFDFVQLKSFKGPCQLIKFLYMKHMSSIKKIILIVNLA